MNPMTDPIGSDGFLSPNRIRWVLDSYVYLTLYFLKPTLTRITLTTLRSLDQQRDNRKKKRQWSQIAPLPNSKTGSNFLCFDNFQQNFIFSITIRAATKLFSPLIVQSMGYPLIVLKVSHLGKKILHTIDLAQKTGPQSMRPIGHISEVGECKFSLIRKSSSNCIE